MKRKILSILGIVGVAVALVTGTANASVRPLTGGNHGCTNTNPEYTLSDVNATVHYTPGSVKFNAVHSPINQWNDTYLISGFNRGSNAVILCGHYGGDFAYQLPFSASAPANIVGSMTYTATGHGTRGWDLWLVRNGEEARETTARAMESDRRSAEIMVVPGQYGVIRAINGYWHRIYIGGGNLKGANLGNLVHTAMDRAGISPSDYQWETIAAGSEFTSGSFNMTGYDLSITTAVTEKRSATATASYTAKNAGFSITATKRVTTTIAKTVTLPVKGHPLHIQRGRAGSAAAIAALATAKTQAPVQALSAAHQAATDAMYIKLHPFVRLPRVVHKRLGQAIAIMRRARFTNLRWTRGLKPSAVVYWQAGHPGHLTSIKARIIIRARG